MNDSFHFDMYLSYNKSIFLKNINCFDTNVIEFFTFLSYFFFINCFILIFFFDVFKRISSRRVMKFHVMKIMSFSLKSIISICKTLINFRCYFDIFDFTS